MNSESAHGRFSHFLARYAAPLRVLLWLAGLAAWVWAFRGAAFRDAEGLATGLITFPLAAGLALGLAGLALGRRWQTFGLWLALALVGQAATLQLIAAGPALRYQHYRPLEAHPLPLLVLLLQTLLVLAHIRPHLRAAWRGLRRRFRPWQLALLAL
ncbi:MAG: hypothetical protein KC425_27075, partial [Anaerolineales bacterium]|nr:hypothetical protein [Anaerolineales bacterium]